MILWFALFYVCLLLLGWTLLSTFRLLYPKPRILTPPDAAGPWQMHRLTAKNGASFSVWEITAEKPRGLVLLCHGYFANRFQVKGIAARLAAQGYTALVMELRGHGSRPGPCTLGAREANDARLILQWAAQQPNLRNLPVSLLGFSMGAAVLLQVAVSEPQVKALVADSVYGRLFPILQQGLRQEYHLGSILWTRCTWLGAQCLLRRRLGQLDPALLAAQGQQMLLMIHGGEDKRVPVESTLQVYERWAGQKQRWFDPQVAHVGMFAKNTEDYAQRVVAFLDRACGIIMG